MDREVDVLVGSKCCTICEIYSIRKFLFVQVLFISKELDVLEGDEIITCSSINERISSMICNSSQDVHQRF
jgi:hypothetical protein